MLNGIHATFNLSPRALTGLRSSPYLAVARGARASPRLGISNAEETVRWGQGSSESEYGSFHA